MNGTAQLRPLFVRRSVLTLCLLFASSPDAFAQRDARPSPSPSVETAPPSSPVNPPLEHSLSEIATGIDDLNRLQQEVERRVTDDSERLVIQRNVENFGSDLDVRAGQAEEMLNSLPSLPELQDLHTEWLTLGNRLSGLRASLVANAAKLNADIDWLNIQQSKWSGILAQIQADASLEELLSRITQSLDAIQRTQKFADDRLKFNVTSQTRVSERDQFIAQTLEKISNQRTLIQRGLLQADSRPLWDRSSRGETDAGLRRVLNRNYTHDLIRARELISARRNALLLAVLILFLTFAAALRMCRLLPGWIEAGIVAPEFIHVFRRPLSLAFFTGLLATVPLIAIAPAIIRGLISVLLVIPTLRLIGPKTPAASRPLLVTLILSTLLLQLIKLTTVSPSLKRDLLAVSALAIVCVIAWLIRRIRKSGDPHNPALLLFSARLVLVLIFASLVANVFGYFALSQVLADACLIGAYYGLVLYTAREVAVGVFSTLIQTETAKRLATLRENGAVIIRWLRTLFSMAAWIILIISLLRLFTIRDAVFATLIGWLNTPIITGANGFTAGNIFSFVLVMAIGFIGATAMRVVLREDVLQRLPVRQGVPFAVSTITYYILLIFIFIVALIAAGVELSKFTLFTGAFGIGVGFGLQNTINNFASGLILLFERPIRENDILEVEGTFGEVTRIGMRSTSIRTAEEAEVIMPNSNLVAGKVVNWSRLGRRRPVELPVRVAYGCDAAAVISLLVETAGTHEDVLADPPPKAFLQGFGEKGLEFCLVFWVGRYHLHRSVLSDVAVRVSDALTENKIEVPSSK
jgi:potassium efflux system protein